MISPKRFFASFILLVLSGLTVFGLQITGAATFPTQNPPSGNIAPQFSSVDTTGNVTVGGNVRVGDKIQPKSGTTLSIDTVGTNTHGSTNFTGSIDIKDNATIQGAATVSGLTTLQATKIGGDITPIDPDGTLNVLGKFAATDGNFATSLNLGPDIMLTRGGTAGNQLTFSFNDVDTCQPGQDCPVGSIVKGSINVKSPLSATSLYGVNGITGSKIGKFSLVGNNVQIQSPPKALPGQPQKSEKTSVVAACPANSVAIACSGYLDTPLPSDQYLGSPLFTLGVNICVSSAQRNVVSNQATFINAVATCFDPTAN
jgi:hypothetical protein